MAIKLPSGTGSRASCMLSTASAAEPRAYNDIIEKSGAAPQQAIFSNKMNKLSRNQIL